MLLLSFTYFISIQECLFMIIALFFVVNKLFGSECRDLGLLILIIIIFTIILLLLILVYQSINKQHSIRKLIVLILEFGRNLRVTLLMRLLTRQEDHTLPRKLTLRIQTLQNILILTKYQTLLWTLNKQLFHVKKVISSSLCWFLLINKFLWQSIL